VSSRFTLPPLLTAFFKLKGNMMSDILGPATDKSKNKSTRVKLLVSRTNGMSALAAGAEITVPEWEASRMVDAGQAEIVAEKK